MTVLKFLVEELVSRLARGGGREAACLSLLVVSASCVPLAAAPAPPQEVRGEGRAAAALQRLATAPAPDADPTALRPVSPTDAVALNAAIPVAGGPNPRAASVVFRASSPLDQERALQCLAEAVYYEARSESEDGQRAVAQVVLNRVRHPSYPGSVCGVVYQGPMRAGGGCQFTFTCDGSLAATPQGLGWARARRIAGEALAGSVYAPVGHATHYHTHAVLPFWAYKLAKVGVVGSHNFYRLENAWGTPRAFNQRYAAREPSPAAVIAERLPVSLSKLAAAPAAPVLDYSAWTPPPQLPVALPAATPEPASPPVDDRLPASGVKPEYANSGRWLTE